MKVDRRTIPVAERIASLATALDLPDGQQEADPQIWMAVTEGSAAIHRHFLFPEAAERGERLGYTGPDWPPEVTLY